MSYLQVQRLANVKDEFDIANASVDYLESTWPRLQQEKGFSDFKFPQIRRAAANIEATYCVRLFSTFEGILREVLPARSFAGPDRRSAYDLINRSASRWRISASVRDEAHRIRNLRNQYVHRENRGTHPILFADALAGLSRFLSWLPSPEGA